MSAAAEVGLTAGREIRKNLRSTKGIAMFALFVVGGLLLPLGKILIDRLAKSEGGQMPSDEAIRQGKLFALTKVHGETMAKYLVDCPTALLILFKATLFFFPLLILMVGFDAISGETQHRTMRYMTPRARRASIAIGKGLGVWGVTAIMLLVLYGTSWIMMLIDGGNPAGAVLSWGTRLWLFAAVYGGAYVGLIMLMSSIFRTPVVSLFTAFGVMVAMGLTRTILDLFDSTKAITWAFPAQYEEWLLSPDPSRVVSACAVLVAWGALCLMGATEIVRRKDI